MKQGIIKEMRKLNPVTFRELEHNVTFARMLRKTIFDNKIPRRVVVKHFNTTDVGLSDYMVGAKTLNVLDIAKVETLHLETIGRNPLKGKEFIEQYPEFTI